MVSTVEKTVTYEINANVSAGQAIENSINNGDVTANVVSAPSDWDSELLLLTKVVQDVTIDYNISVVKSADEQISLVTEDVFNSVSSTDLSTVDIVKFPESVTEQLDTNDIVNLVGTQINYYREGSPAQPDGRVAYSGGISDWNETFNGTILTVDVTFIFRKP